MKRNKLAQNSKELFYTIGSFDERLLREKEFEISLTRTTLERIRRGFIKTYRPVMDDVPYRIFPRMRDYHKWCESELPRWLGYGRAK